MRTLLYRRAWRAFGLAVVAGLFLSSRAHACTCNVLPSEPYPKNGSKVPRNTKFWLPWITAFRSLSPKQQDEADRSVPWYGGHGPVVSAGDVAESYRLRDPAGHSVPFSVSTLAIGRAMRPAYFVLTPAHPLVTGAHTLQRAHGDPGAFQMSVTVEERTLAFADTPRVQFLPGSSPSRRASCGHGFFIPFNASHSGMLTVLGLTEEVRPVSEHPAWVSDVFDSHAGFVGQGVCRSNWDFHQGPIFARIGAFDVAGNFSGWTAAVQLEVPQEAFDEWDRGVVKDIAKRLGVPPQSPRGCSCNLFTVGSPGVLPHALALWALWLRRRTRVVIAAVRFTTAAAFLRQSSSSCSVGADGRTSL
jgi:hypothetical protein